MKIILIAALFLTNSFGLNILTTKIEHADMNVYVIDKEYHGNIEQITDCKMYSGFIDPEESFDERFAIHFSDMPRGTDFWITLTDNEEEDTCTEFIYNHKGDHGFDW